VTFRRFNHQETLPNIVAPQQGPPEAGKGVETANATSSASASRPRRKAAIYVRVSRFDEKVPTASPDTQEATCRQVPEIKGLEVTVFRDLNLSGKNTDRPEYLAMLHEIEAGAFAFVVAYEYSRITRDVGDQASFLKLVHKHGVAFISARERIDVSNPEGKFAATVLGGSNQLQREQTARRVKDALAQKVARGEPVGRLLPGYRRVKTLIPNGAIKTTIEVDPTAGKAVEVLFAEYATGAHSFRTLAAWMNKQGYAVPRSVDVTKGGAFSPLWDGDKVRSILSNDGYAGKVIRNDGREFSASFPPIIDRETWNLTMRLRITHRFPIRENRKVPTYILTGLLHCARCGGSVSGLLKKKSGRQDGVSYAYYHCYSRRLKRGCVQPLFRQADIEARVIELLTELAVPDGLAEAVDAAVAAYAKQQRGFSRAARRKAINARLGRLRDLFEMGDVTREEYDQKKSGLQIERDQLEVSPSAGLISRERQQLQTIVEDWPRMTDNEKKRLLGLVLTEIRADHVEGSIAVTFKPRPEWEPYVDAVIAGKTAESAVGSPVATSERKTGLEPATPTLARLCSTN
jgi:site-specific DNA recombinase